MIQMLHAMLHVCMAGHVLAAAPLVRHKPCGDGVGAESDGAVDGGKGENRVRVDAKRFIQDCCRLD
jgi:hypothetical protein